MAEIRKCANPDCGAEFEAIPVSRKYCCYECKKIMDRKRWSDRSKKTYKRSALGEISAEAKKAGMTYGKYVAMYGL